MRLLDRLQEQKGRDGLQTRRLVPNCAFPLRERLLCVHSFPISDCKTGTFSCGNGKCVRKLIHRCEGVDDCGNGADEKDCKPTGEKSHVGGSNACFNQCVYKLIFPDLRVRSRSLLLRERQVRPEEPEVRRQGRLRKRKRRDAVQAGRWVVGLPSPLPWHCWHCRVLTVCPVPPAQSASRTRSPAATAAASRSRRSATARTTAATGPTRRTARPGPRPRAVPSQEPRSRPPVRQAQLNPLLKKQESGNDSRFCLFIKPPVLKASSAVATAVVYPWTRDATTGRIAGMERMKQTVQRVVSQQDDDAKVHPVPFPNEPTC